MMQRLFYIGALCAVLFAAGCSDKVMITGTAKMADGTTVTCGTVYFRNATAQYSADIKPNGTFSPGITKDGEAIPPGVYQVYVTGVGREEGVEKTLPDGTIEYPKMVSLIDEKYGHESTSGLSIDTSKQKKLDLVLDPAK
jgi:hypothetical protein